MRNILIILIIAFVLSACGHNMRESFNPAFEKYNDMVAADNFPGSALFVADKAKDSYIASIAAARNTRVFEYKTINRKINEPSRKAIVEIEYNYYFLNSNTVKSLRYVQEWSYFEENDFKGWRLLTPLPSFK
jgi:hypothetical protein